MRSAKDNKKCTSENSLDFVQAEHVRTKKNRNKRKQSRYKRRKTSKVSPLSLDSDLAAELIVDDSRTEVGFTRNQRQTEVGSTIDVNDGDTEDGDAEDGDPDGDDGYTADDYGEKKI